MGAELFHRGGHSEATKNIGVAHHKQNFSFIMLLSNIGHLKYVEKEKNYKFIS